MTLPTLTTVILLSGVVMAACRSPVGAPSSTAPSLNDAPIAMPQPVDVWEGSGTFVGHLSRGNNLYFAGQPDDDALRSAPVNNISTVINLRTPPELSPDRLGFDERALIESLEIRYVSIPLTGESFSARDADRLAEALAATPAGRSAMIHCGSSNRVGALWALYLARHRGVPIEDAIEHGRAAGLRSDALEQKVRSLAE